MIDVGRLNFHFGDGQTSGFLGSLLSLRFDLVTFGYSEAEIEAILEEIGAILIVYEIIPT